MAKRRPRHFVPYFRTEDPVRGFSAIAPLYWRYAERLRTEALSRKSQFDAAVIPAICLYHAVLECYINEELALRMALGNSDEELTKRCLAVQDMTLNDKKLRDFIEAYGLREQFNPGILHHAVMLARFRNKLHHHSPEMRETNLYPVEAAEVFKRVSLEPINTSWITQSMNIRVCNWCSEVARQFIEEFCRCAGKRSDFELPGWTAA